MTAPDPPITFVGPAVADVGGIGALTLGGLLREVTERFAGNVAIVFDDPLRGGATVRWSYADLGAETRRIARALVAVGIVPGDAVGIVMGNRPEAVAAIFAAAMVGAVAVPLSTFAPPPELAGMLRMADASVVLTQARLLGRSPGDEIRALDPTPRRVVVLGEDGWDGFLAAGSAIDDAELDRRCAAVTTDDPALVIFSSGTTSTPKGILHAHRAPSLQMWVQARMFGRHPGTRMWSAFPVFWTAGLNTAVGATLAAGGCWVAQETFEPGAALALMSRERVTEPYCLPHQIGALEEHPDWATTDLSSCRCVFGKSALARHPTVQGDPGWTMPVGYGLSETCALVVAHGSDASREATRRSMGALVPGAELRVVDPDTGHALGVGDVGELALRGPMLMLGYLGQERAACFDEDGFFHTGDAGHVDGRGELHFAGRRTEMIKTGGANVSPAEVEVELRAFPPVKISRVVGLPDPRLDQVAVACIVLKHGATSTEADVQAFLRTRLSSFKVPKHVLFLTEDEMPMTASGTKVRREVLLPIAAAAMARRGAGAP